MKAILLKVHKHAVDCVRAELQGKSYSMSLLEYFFDYLIIIIKNDILVVVDEVNSIKEMTLSQIGDIQQSLTHIQTNYNSMHKELVVR